MIAPLEKGERPYTVDQARAVASALDTLAAAYEADGNMFEAGDCWRSAYWFRRYADALAPFEASPSR